MAAVSQTHLVCVLSSATVVSTPILSLGPARVFVQLSGLEKLIGVEHQPFFAQGNRSSYQFATQLQDLMCKQGCQRLGLPFYKM